MNGFVIFLEEWRVTWVIKLTKTLMRVFIYATHFVLILSCITLSDSSYDQVFPSENLLVQSQQWKRRAVTCLYMYILYIYIYIWVLGLAFHWRAHLLVWYKSLFNSLQKCQHCWLHKINVYHLETILELIIGHGQYRWHKPKKKRTKTDPWDSCASTCPWRSLPI